MMSAFVATLVTTASLATLLFGGIVPPDGMINEGLFTALAASSCVLVMTCAALDA